MKEKKIPNEIYYIDNISSQLRCNMLHLASPPFSSSSINTPSFLRKNREKKREEQEKIEKEWKNSKKNTLVILKKFFSPSLGNPPPKKKKKPRPFVGKLVGMGQFLNNYTHTISFYYLENIIFIYILSAFLYIVLYFVIV